MKLKDRINDAILGFIQRIGDISGVDETKAAEICLFGLVGFLEGRTSRANMKRIVAKALASGATTNEENREQRLLQQKIGGFGDPTQ